MTAVMYVIKVLTAPPGDRRASSELPAFLRAKPNHGLALMYGELMIRALERAHPACHVRASHYGWRHGLATFLLGRRSQ